MHQIRTFLTNFSLFAFHWIGDHWLTRDETMSLTVKMWELAGTCSTVNPSTVLCCSSWNANLNDTNWNKLFQLWKAMHWQYISVVPPSCSLVNLVRVKGSFPNVLCNYAAWNITLISSITLPSALFGLIQKDCCRFIKWTFHGRLTRCNNRSGFLVTVREQQWAVSVWVRVVWSVADSQTFTGRLGR